MEAGWLLVVHGCKTMHSHPRHMERTLERLLQIQAAMEELAVALDQAEGVRDAWEPVGDLFIDSLQDHIDATKVQCTAPPSALYHILIPVSAFDLTGVALLLPMCSLLLSSRSADFIMVKSQPSVRQHLHQNTRCRSECKKVGLWCRKMCVR